MTIPRRPWVVESRVSQSGSDAVSSMYESVAFGCAFPSPYTILKSDLIPFTIVIIPRAVIAFLMTELTNLV